MSHAAPDLDLLRHSFAHVCAAAVQELFPGVKFGFGPATEDGFFYDFDFGAAKLEEKDLPRIEKAMRKIIGRREPFTRTELDQAGAEARCAAQSYKLEQVKNLAAKGVERFSFYACGRFEDLCEGPHAAGTGELDADAFKLTRIAGAYWLGSEENPMLTRIYGWAFADRAGLEQYAAMRKAAEERDHRKLGRELDLFSISDAVGPGLVLWHPMGARVRRAIEDFWREKHERNGYELLFTPHVGRANLWETSGHLGFYRESMYAPMVIEEQEYFAKPMNCPFHIEVYKTQGRSYRDLPLRWAELGTVYRYEKSGVLSGLFRVRGFTQDDAHIFCRPDQIEDEISEVLRFCLEILGAFGFTEFKVYLATRPADAVGDPARWDEALRSLKKAVDRHGIRTEVDEGGGAFYGPKIDLKIKDALGREWQCSTIQFDFNMSERFDVTYIGEDGQRHRPYMVHRALFGSLERFFGILVEHWGGAFPSWCAPVQAVLVPVRDELLDYARTVLAACKAAGLRAEIDDGNNSFNKKIRTQITRKVPNIMIVGDREREKEELTWRRYGLEGQRTLPWREFLAEVQEEIRQRRPPGA